MWLASLDEPTRARVTNVLRMLRNKSHAALLRSSWIGERSGDTLEVGSAHLDDYLKGVGIGEFLRHLEGGAYYLEAAEQACATLRDIIIQWNATHEWQQHRDKDCGADHVQAAVIHVDLALRRADA